MSYTTYEKSDYSGHPLELYRFALGSQIWLFTSADHEVAYGEDVYKPVFVKREGFTKGGDARKSNIEIQVAAANSVALPFRTGWLGGVMTVTIYRHHAGDSEYAVLWKGRVTSCKWAGSVATLTSDNVSTLFARAGLRRVYQVGCPHVLYGTACGLDASAWQVSALVSEVADGVLTLDGISGYGAGYFLGGMVQAGDDRRLIVAHAAGAVTMVDSIADIAAGDTVTLWPGCARTMNACAGKFNNLDNYGGLPFLPSKNPFSGDALV